MAVATYVDVATALGRPISTEAEQDQVEWWLTGVELVLWARLGDVAALKPEAVRYVEAEAVAAKVERRASQGASSITVNVDDGGVTRRYDGQVTAGDITDEWWNLLSGHSRGTVRVGWLLR